MKQSLLIFSKYPTPGEAKTRLAGPLPAGWTFFSQNKLSTQDAAIFSACFIKDMLFKSTFIPTCQPVLHYTPDNAFSAFKTLLPFHRDFCSQSSGDLGSRMQLAFQVAFDAGMKAVILIGSDIPTLPPAIITKAFHYLKEYPITLGPCHDGGYYLIGLQKPAPRLFKDIDWGSAQVINQTINSAKSLNLEIKLLPTWYDIDQPKDIIKVAMDFLEKKANIIYSPWTYKFMRASGLLHSRRDQKPHYYK